MVVVCESCSTRFRIDDARIPAKGRLVRCSQCKATFIAKPEDATFEETVEEVVAEVTDSGAAPVPEPATDLFDEGGGDLGGGGAATQPPSATDEERWEFDEEPRKLETEPLVRSARVETEPPTSALDDIGDPTEWDLLRGSVEREAKQAAFVEEPPPPPPPPRERRAEPKVEADPEPFLRPIAAEAPAAPARTVRRTSGSGALGRFARSAVGLGAWTLLAALAFAATEPLVPREAQRETPRAMPRTIGLADGEARDVRGRFIENAFAPALFVVEGQLARPSGDPRLGLRVHFESPGGASVGEPAWAGAALAAQDLRERTPAFLRSQLDASAAQAARGGRFVAVFEQAPAEATSFGLSLAPLPTPPEPPAEPQAAAEATASSPPSSPPSSE